MISAGPKRHDGLVMEPELLPHGCVAQVGLELHAGHGQGVHRLVEDRHGPPCPGTWPDTSRCPRRGAGPRRGRSSDSLRAMPMLAAMTSSCPFSEKGDCSSSRARSAIWIHVPEVFDVVGEDDELVSAEPGDGVALADAAFQPPADRDQELIADLVAQAIVDELEAVEVEEEDGEPMSSVPPSSAGWPGPAGRSARRGWAGRSRCRGRRRGSSRSSAALRWVMSDCDPAMRTAVPWASRTARPRVRTQR